MPARRTLVFSPGAEARVALFLTSIKWKICCWFGEVSRTGGRKVVVYGTKTELRAIMTLLLLLFFGKKGTPD